MNDKKVEEQSQAVEDSQIVTINGKTFDLSTVEGRNQLKGYTEATSALASQKANENHALKQQIEPYRNYQFNNQIVDPLTVRKQIEELKADGRLEEAAELATELALQATQQIEQTRQDNAESQFINDYLSTRPELGLSPELVKSFVFGNHRDAVYGADDKFALVDRILQPHVKHSAPIKQEDEAPIQTLDTTGAPAPAKTESKDEEEAPLSVFDMIVS